MTVRHYKGDARCPDCGGGYDPETGYCSTCEPALALYHIAAFWPEWFDDETLVAPSGVVSARGVSGRVAEYLADEPRLITIQRLREEGVGET